ncbi:MAG: acetolactate synthase, partial [Polaromonas sp.]|nr:acetolactate synthase [Polaromonas sp.]
VRAAEMIDQVLPRGLQIACTVPEGPIYLTGARQVWDEPAVSPTQPAQELISALSAARKPLLITRNLGRQPEAVGKLAELSQRVSIAVCEVNPQYVNFPGDHSHHIGYRRNTLVDGADLILTLDVDVPWIISKAAPRADARLFHLDCDPLKADMGFRHFSAERTWQADSLAALDQLLALAAQGDALREPYRH